jgi:hypothetical protein
VSIGKDHQNECIRTLARACDTALRGQFVFAENLLMQARLLAPGLALRALGSGDTALKGLLGLLLTARELGVTERLVLSLDQHSQLLSGSGFLADLISLSVANDGSALYVDIAEAKFTVGAVSLTSEPVAKAIRQLSSTTARLERFGTLHPLSARMRGALVRAAVQQIHLLDRAIGEKERRVHEEIVNFLRDATKPIVVAPIARATVHVWSCGEETQDSTDASAGPRIFIHGRASTLKRLREL